MMRNGECVMVADLFRCWLINVLLASVQVTAMSSEYPTANHYWPLLQTNYTTTVDLIGRSRADLHGVKYVDVAQLGSVTSLDGNRRWIDFDTESFLNDCIGNPVYCERGFSIAFWIRLIGGKSIMATGGMTNSTRGTGLSIEYYPQNDIVNASIIGHGKLWSVQVGVFKHAWCHVTLTWSNRQGFRFYLDGQQAAVDRVGKPVKTLPARFSKVITVGKPINIIDLDGFGRFDIAHLAIWYYELAFFQASQAGKRVLKVSNEAYLCCFNKSVDICFSRPCSSGRCAGLEKAYSNCICVELGHKRCKGEYERDATYELGTSTEPYKYEYGTVEVLTEDTGGKECSGLKCDHYGTCRVSRGIYYCACPDNCSSEANRICGSNERTYLNECILKQDSCKTKKSVNVSHSGTCNLHYKDAKHYWPMNNFSSVGMLTDLQGSGQAVAYNRPTRKSTEQLGYVISLDGVDDWVRITGFDDSCVIDPTNCDKGLTLAVWLRILGGEYIISAGNYAALAHGPGFRFYRVVSEKHYVLEVSTSTQLWRLVVHTLPMDWFHFAFTWSQKEGLKMFIDSQILLWDNNPLNVTQNNNNMAKVIVIGRPDSFVRLRSHGEMDIGHFVIWKYPLKQAEIKSVYTAMVTVTPDSTVCCYFKNGAKCIRYPCYRFSNPSACRQNEETNKCICPEIQRPGKCLERTFRGVCEDKRVDCHALASQGGYCDQFQQEMERECPVSCNYCANNNKPTAQRRRLSRETLIFALTGCVLGIIFLLLVSIYSWKVYRSKYSGAFMPPKNSGSLIEVDESYDSKWTKKYIDSCAFQIKDVPPKKLALPVIPSQTTTKPKYQPPEFD